MTTDQAVGRRATDQPAGRSAERSLGPEEFRNVFRRHPAGVAVVALTHDSRPVGFTATSVISVSADPPLLTFSVAATSSSWPAVAVARTLTVSFLAEDQEHLSARFSTSGIDRFADGGWSTLPTGEPVIDGAVSWVRARIVQRTAVGGSWLVSVRALESGGTGGAPLVYHDRTYRRLGDTGEGTGEV
ncbi:MAG: flavin reductase family protein [Cellulomonas sp.]|jgi:flavin reductase (DIM6/NTAB) family NADH-FMN oxidoreductase RutF|nr:flavin reductase family protein [Cellulomonas sp.]